MRNETPRGPDRESRPTLLRPGSWAGFIEGYRRRREKEKQDLDVYRALGEGARPSVEFSVLIILSCLIATMGLVQGSAPAIIGAMIIAPLMTPILSFSLGVIWGDVRMLRNAVLLVAGGVVLSVIISALISLVVPFEGYSAEILARIRPTPFDIIVALGSGALAAFGYAHRKVVNALTGVAIAVSLVPPLCVAGIGLGRFDIPVAAGAALLFATNLVAISLAAAVVFWMMKIHPANADSGEVQRRALWQIVVSAVLLGLIAVPVVISLDDAFRQQSSLSAAHRAVAAAIPDASIIREQVENERGALTLRLLVAAPSLPSADALRQLDATIAGPGSRFAKSRIDIVQALADPQG